VARSVGNRVALVAVAVITAAAAGALVVSFIDLGGDKEPAAAGNSDTVETTGEAPATEFARFDGSTGSFADYRGRPVVVNFWASWCVPCVDEMPAFEKVHQELGDQVAFLGLDLRDRLEDGRALAQRTGVTYDLARDPSGEFIEAFGGKVMPTTVLLSGDGRTVQVHSGKLSRAELEELIRGKLLA
jgi:thiol-disulfide isomerase/thioredoxin